MSIIVFNKIKGINIMSKNKKDVRILSIDPGLSHLAWSIINHNTHTGKTTVKRFGEVTANKVVSKVAMREQTVKYGTRIIALNYIQERISEIMRIHKPDHVVIENAFFCSRFPNAFIALVQTTNVIEMILLQSFQKPLHRISPKEAKYAISGSGSSGKLDIQKAVKEHAKIEFQQEKNIERMTEHVADSIAIAYAFILNILPNLMTLQ